jgi:hypothetical protein
VTEIVDHATDDDAVPLSIVHSRDTIIIDGTIDQDYRFLVYRFAGGVEARMYLDDAWEVSITAPIDTAVPPPVMTYLQRRFRCVKQLGGPDGYRILWEAGV